MNVSRKNLVLALNSVSPAIVKGTDSPIYNAVLLKSEKGEGDEMSLRMTVSGYDMLIEATLSGEGKKEDVEIAVNLKKLLEVSRSLSGSLVSIRSTATRFKLETEREKAEVVGVDHDGDFGIGIVPSGAELIGSFSIGGSDLNRAVKGAAVCAAKDKDRPALEGILFSVRDRRAILRSADGHRLAICEADLLENIDASLSALVPAKALAAAADALKDEKEITVEVYKDRVVLRGSWLIYSIVPIDEAFPEIDNLVPKTSKVKVDIDRGGLILAVKRGDIVNRAGDYPYIGIEVRKEDFVIRAGDPTVATHEEFLTAEVEGVDGKAFEFHLSAALFSDILGVVEDEKVRIAANDPTTPVVIAGSGDGLNIWAVAPMIPTR